MLFSRRLPDARGIAVRLVVLDRLEDRRELTRELWRGRAGVRPLLATHAFAAIPFGVACIQVGIDWWMTPSVLLRWSFVAIFTFAFAIAFVGIRAVWRRWLATRMLEIGRCASCGYVIARCPATDAGDVMCPECAAHWRLPKVLD